MAKIKEMSFHKTLKLSHNYNSYDVGFGVVISVTEADDTAKVKETGWNTVDTELDKQIIEMVKVLSEIGD